MPSFPLAQSSAGVHTRAQPGVPMPAPSPSGLPDQLSGAGSPPTSPTGDPMKCSLSRYPLGRKGGEAVHSLNPHLALLSGTLGCWLAPVTRVFPQPAPPLPSVPTPPTNPAATPRGFSENPPYSEQELTCTRPLVFVQRVANPAAAIVAPHVVVTVMTTEGFAIQQLFALIDI